MSNQPQRVIEIKPIYRQEQIQTPKEEEVLQAEKRAKSKIAEAEQHLQTAKQQAEKLLEDARQDIEAERNKWEEERKVLVTKAREEGFQSGFEDGKNQGLNEYKSLLQEANQIIDQANGSYHSIIKSSEETIVELALSCAEKILNQELTQTPEMFLGVVRKAIQEVKNQPEMSVYVHPDQYGLVIAQQEELQSITHSRAQLSIYVSDEVTTHSCIVESAFGRIDASVDQQLHELRQQLFEIVNEELSHE